VDLPRVAAGYRGQVTLVRSSVCKTSVRLFPAMRG
jgi:hypothetical protein